MYKKSLFCPESRIDKQVLSYNFYENFCSKNVFLNNYIVEKPGWIGKCRITIFMRILVQPYLKKIPQIVVNHKFPTFAFT